MVTPTEDTKQCPYCAETIKEDAVLCRFCGSSLVEEEPAAGSPAKESRGAPKGCIAVWWIYSILLYLYTVLTAFMLSGPEAAIITFMAPVLGQVYWFLKIWSLTGTLFTTYGVAVMGYVVLMIILQLGWSGWTSK